MNAMLHDANTWVALSFAVFLLGFFRFAMPALLGALDARSDAIRRELDEAVRLRETAQALLADYQQKQKEMQAEADSLIAAAKQSAAALSKQAEADVQRMIEQRMKQAQESISRSEAAALADIHALMVESSIQNASTLLQGALKAEQHQALIDDAIRGIKAAIH